MFPKRFPHPYKYSWGISHEYLPEWPESTEREIISLCLCHTIFINFKVMYLKKCLNSRSSHQSCSIWKAVLKNFAIFTWSLLLIYLRVQDPQLSLKGTPTQVFSCEYCKIFKNTYFDENLRTTASAVPTSYC